MNPGRSHGSADTLPLRHSANSFWRYVQFFFILIQIPPTFVHRGTFDNVIIGSGNGLVPSGTKSLPEPMMTKINNAIWHHYGTVS